MKSIEFLNDYANERYKETFLKLNLDVNKVLYAYSGSMNLSLLLAITERKSYSEITNKIGKKFTRMHLFFTRSNLYLFYINSNETDNVHDIDIISNLSFKKIELKKIKDFSFLDNPNIYLRNGLEQNLLIKLQLQEKLDVLFIDLEIGNINFHLDTFYLLLNFNFKTHLNLSSKIMSDNQIYAFARKLLKDQSEDLSKLMNLKD